MSPDGSDNTSHTPTSRPKEFVVIRGSDELGPFGSYAEAVSAGRERYQSDDFVVTRVDTPHEPTNKSNSV